jgi:beta-lactamase regulating signal transducer with metallopeptidase domain
MLTLAELALKVFALVGLAALASWGLRRASAALRHRMWAAALASMPLVAATSVLLPAWPVPAPWMLPRVEGLTVSTPAHATVAAVQEHEGVSFPSAPELPRRTLLLLWFLGASALTLRLLVGHARLHGIARRARGIEGCPGVRLVMTDELPVPATWGLLHPVIALPSGAASWSRAEMDDVMRHEMAHVRRRDVLTQALADAVCALLWFHPAVWYAAGRLRAESERACDDAVLAEGSDGVAYAEMLYGIAARRIVPSAIGVATARGLEARLRAILDPRVTRRSSRGVMAAVPAGVLVGALSIAGFEVFAVAPDVTFGERVPFTLEQERDALARSFAPRDAREAETIERFRDGTRHVRQHEMDYVRDRSLWALSIAHEDEIIAPLAAKLDSYDWRVRAYAAWGLHVAGAHEARGALTERLDDPIWRVRAMAAEALVDLGDARSEAAMVPLLEDPAWQVRVPAVKFLAKLGTPDAARLIALRLDDPHVAVRRAAERAVGDASHN